MHYLVDRLDPMQTVSAHRRLTEFLLCAPGPIDGATTIQLPYEKALVAAHLSMQSEMLSQSFTRLRPVGVPTRGGRVTIADLAALRRYVGRERPWAISGCHPEEKDCGRSPALMPSLKARRIWESLVPHLPIGSNTRCMASLPFAQAAASYSRLSHGARP